MDFFERMDLDFFERMDFFEQFNGKKEILV
jgi:hypothetical protein